MLAQELEKNRTYEDFDLVSKWSSADYDSSLACLIIDTDVNLIERELIDKWGAAGFDGAVSLLMSRKTMRVQKAEVILQKWMHENNEIKFRAELSDMKQQLLFLKIKLIYELGDVVLCAKLRASSNLFLKLIEEHKDLLTSKYKELTYKDDFGRVVMNDFDKELAKFCNTTLAKRYEYHTIIKEYANDLLYKKFLQLSNNNGLRADSNESLKIIRRHFAYQFDAELEGLAKNFCLMHLRNILLKQNIY